MAHVCILRKDFSIISHHCRLYFVVDADLDEEPLAELEDWIGVFRDDVCVGAWPWQGALYYSTSYG